MGYCSNVALALNAEAEKAFQDALKNAEAETVNFCNEQPESYSDHGDNTLRIWRAVKWYEEIDEVKFVTDFHSDQDDEAYRFLRVGEDAGDVEDYGALYGVFELYPETGIHFNVEKSTQQSVLAEQNVRKVYDLALSQISSGDCEKLDREVKYEGEIIVYRKDGGYFIYVPQDDVDEYLGLLAEREFSEGFRNIIRLVSEKGCSWIVADRDARITPSLPINFG
jgi:hypothetical protein